MVSAASKCTAGSVAGRRCAGALFRSIRVVRRAESAEAAL